MRSSRFCHIVAFALALTCAAQGATYEVAQQNPRASDDGPGTMERPWKTIGRAAEEAGPGDVVVIRAGVYRERVLAKSSGTPQAPIRFEAAPGEHVMVTGADRLTGWRKATDETRPIYAVAWPHKFITWNASMTHPSDEYHRLIGRCEQMAVNGYLLRQTLVVRCSIRGSPTHSSETCGCPKKLWPCSRSFIRAGQFRKLHWVFGTDAVASAQV